MKKLLLCVGAAKTGTTWLYRNIRANPGLWFSPEKELNYHFTRHGWFDRLTPEIRRRKSEEALAKPGADAAAEAWYRRFVEGPVGPDWYRSLFAEAPEGRWACDFSPSTSLIPAAGWAEVARFAPEMRYVYIMREPEARLWSHAKFHARYTGAAERFRGLSLRGMERFVERSQLLVDGNYGTNLSAMLTAVPREHVLLLDHERIAASPEAVLREVEGFLGLPETPDPEGMAARPVNVTEPAPPPPGFGDRWRRLFRRETARLAELGAPFAAPWARLHAEKRGRLLPWS